ncbi:MAG: leucine-rich repeat domain-containing protein [Spirochaetaceae bacterium]|jgi:hypothetical protein|nr:leucine-rich repeat domain-containing protein [Spirochaetaceae bacterium]
MKKNIFANRVFSAASALRGVSGKAFPAGVLGAVMLALAVLSCDMPAEPSASAGYGKIRVSFSTASARTVFPVMPNGQYDYYVTRTGESQAMQIFPDQPQLFPDQPQSASPEFTLETGTYTLRVVAYASQDRSNGAAAEGLSAQFTVTAGANNPVTVDLKGRTVSGDGTFAYNIQYPAGVVITSDDVELAPAFTLTKLTEPSTVTPVTPDAWNPTSASNTGMSVSAGFYLGQITLYLPDGRKAVKTDAIHIYSTMTTEWEPPAFNMDDFENLPLTGAVTIKVRPDTGPDTPLINARFGDTLVADAVDADTAPLPGTLSYQWYRHPAKPTALSGQSPTTEIPGATGAIYTLIAADKNQYISVRVTRAGNRGFISSLGSDAALTPGKRVQTSISYSDLATDLASISGGNDADDPIQIYLTDFSSADSITSLGKYAFIDLSSSSGVTSIPNRAFFGLEKLTGITFPGDLTAIPNGAFRGCEALTEITLPTSVASIGNNAFRGCTALTKLTITNNVSIVNLGTNAFTGVENLTIYVDSSLKEQYEEDGDWGSYTFEEIE